jgi:hypothetical protein
MRFRVSVLGELDDVEALLVRLADRSRPPDSSFCYVNRQTGATAEDLDFLFSYERGGYEAMIRDQRLKPPAVRS